MTITTTGIIQFGALLGAVIAIGKLLAMAYDLFRHQAEQDEAIKEIRTELALLLDGIHAALDGLEQQGCNHTVPETKRKLYEHINRQAHK